MKNRRLVLLVWCAATLAAQPSNRRLVLISVDGLMPETLRNAEKSGLRIPNLLEMRDKGAFAQGLVGVFPTVEKLVVDALTTLQGDARWGIEQVLSRTQLAEHKSYPLAFAAVSLRRGFTAGSARSGAWVTSSNNTRGMHGYLPGPAELDSTFLAFGPGITARPLARAQLADIARTAAALLGVDLPSAGGRNLLEVQ